MASLASSRSLFYVKCDKAVCGFSAVVCWGRNAALRMSLSNGSGHRTPPFRRRNARRSHRCKQDTGGPLHKLRYRKRCRIHRQCASDEYGAAYALACPQLHNASVASSLVVSKTDRSQLGAMPCLSMARGQQRAPHAPQRAHTSMHGLVWGSVGERTIHSTKMTTRREGETTFAFLGGGQAPDCLSCSRWKTFLFRKV